MKVEDAVKHLKILGLIAVALIVTRSMIVAAPTQTLFQRLGEQPGIAHLVDEVAHQVSMDARINKVVPKSEATQMKTCFTNWLVCATGGPCPKAKSPAAKCSMKKRADKDACCCQGKCAGKHMSVTSGQFTAFLDDFSKAADKVGITKNDQKALHALLLAHRHQVVHGPAPCPMKH